MHFRGRVSGQNGRLNLLRTDITTEAGELFDNHPRLKNKTLLLDIAIVNPCVDSNLGNAARHVEKHVANAVERKKNKYRGSFPATYFLFALAMSTCGEVGSDVHALMKELAIRPVFGVVNGLGRNEEGDQADIFNTTQKRQNTGVHLKKVDEALEQWRTARGSKRRAGGSGPLAHYLSGLRQTFSSSWSSAVLVSMIVLDLSLLFDDVLVCLPFLKKNHGD